MDRVLKLWNQYEQDARAVAMANGWLLTTAIAPLSPPNNQQVV